MGRKRKNGEGTVRLRKDGRWEGRIVIGYDENADPVPSDFDLAKYTKEVFSMYDGKSVLVDLKCDNSLMKVIIDRFGEDVTVLAYDMTSFRLKIEVSASPTFYGWIFGFGGKVQILGPKQIRDEYAMMVSSAQANLAE